MFILGFVCLNFYFFKVTIVNDIVWSSITMFSIVYGFLVSSVVNLFGREITKEMKRRSGLDGRSVLGDFKKSISNFIFRGILFISIATIYVITKEKSIQLLNPSYLITFELVTSGYILSQLTYILFSMYYYFVELLNMLMDETVLTRTKN